MKHLKLLIIAMSMVGLFFVGCDEDEPQIKITSITFNSASVEVVEGTTVNLDDLLTIEGEDADQADISFETNDEEVVSVDGNTLSAVAVGETQIVATETNTNKTATIDVTVIADNVSVTGVSLSEETIEIEIGETSQLTATLAPEDATNKEVTWTVEFPAGAKKSEDQPTSIATVSDEGLVTAVSPGEVVVVVTTADGEFTASTDVTVTGIPVTGVEMDQETADLDVGSTLQLTATVSPANATEQGLVWSVDFPSEAKVNESTPEDIATVSDDGLVTGVSSGVVVITAETNDGAFTASTEVTVNNVHITEITISPDPIEVNVNETVQLSATVSPENATDKTISWSLAISTADPFAGGRVAPEAYATIDSEGVITGVSACDGCGLVAVATANDDGAIEATLPVKVVYVPVTSITLDPDSYFTVAVDGTYQMEYTILPENATDQTVTWAVDFASSACRIAAVEPTIDDYATIDDNGLITGVAVSGRSTCGLVVSASVADLEAAAEVDFNVVKYVTGLTILDSSGGDAGSSISFGSGCDETYSLGVTIDPEDATDRTVTWSIEDQDYFQINSSGQVSAKTTLPWPLSITFGVMVSANDGSGVAATVEMTFDNSGCD